MAARGHPATSAELPARLPPQRPEKGVESLKAFSITARLKYSDHNRRTIRRRHPRTVPLSRDDVPGHRPSSWESARNQKTVRHNNGVTVAPLPGRQPT